MKMFYNFPVTKDEIIVEKQQYYDEGKDISSISVEIEKFLKKKDISDRESQDTALKLLEKLKNLPLRKNYKYIEPSEIKDIFKLRDKNYKRSSIKISKKEVNRKIRSALIGRCAGCLLGKPVEGWSRGKIINYLKDSGQFPVSNYITAKVPKSILEKYEIDPKGCFIENVDGMPEDDDINYTIAGKMIIEKFGISFTTKDVADFWVNNIPCYRTFTAERVAYRNYILGIMPPETATFRNPYREWIGAQIRADYFGYVCGGNPEKAAELAFKDAVLSHIKNGIYGEMWVSAMVASSFIEEDIEKVIKAGLSQIPETSRLYESLNEIISFKKSGKKFEDVISLIHSRYDEKNPHHWCHTISNAMIVTTALLYGQMNFEKSIVLAMISGFDTDCNCATVGSIMGLMFGEEKIPCKWKRPLKNKIHTSICKNNTITFDSLLI